MADVAEAIAAAMAAAVPPTSPQIKAEPSSNDAMIIDSEPERPRSPLKRSRSPHDDDEQSRSEKRFKAEAEAEPEVEAEVEDMNGVDEIARLVQQAEASVMQQFQPSEHDKVDDFFDNAEHIQDIATIEEPHEPQVSTPVEDEAPRPESLWSNPRDFTRRKHIIPALGSLAVDILVAWSEQSLEDTIATLSGDPDSDVTKEYGVLRAAFDAQRKLLSDAYPLLNAEQLNVTSETKEVIRIVNLAAACASVFGTNELGLEELNDHFLRVFVPENQEVPQDTAELFLGLKTQIFLALLETEQEKSRAQLLDELFVTGLESALHAHHPSLSPTATELELVANANARKTMLLNESGDGDSIQALGKQFTYEAFLDGLSTYLNDHIESIKAQGTGKVETIATTEDVTQEEVTEGLDGTFDLDAVIAEASRAAQNALEPSGELPHGFDDLSAFLAENISKAAEQAKENAATDTELPSAIASAAESASRATMLALQSIQQNQYQPTALPQPNTQTPPTSNHTYQPHQSQSQPQQHYYQYPPQPPNNAQPTYHAPNDHLPPNQTDSTPALYERARQAAAARSSTHARREGSHSTRRPWSPEEEKALMMGLDMVKGPHWSQILSLFGPNGSISNILADRTQVQLKDKARNLKLFFLKTNSEMPYYLQCVTGELKTRAPTQAARKEAEEKARLNSEEHQAHVNGILTLANGLQNNATSRQSPSVTAPRSGTPNQPLSHPSSHPGSQPGTPRVSQQPIQPSTPAPAPMPRPVIPAPQPVSLPTFTSTAQKDPPPPPPPVSQPQPAPEQQTAPPATTPVTPPTTQSNEPEPEPEPEKIEMSIEDAALLGLKAALEQDTVTQSTAPAADPNGAAEHLSNHVNANST